MNRRLAAIALAAVVSFGLAACSGSSSPAQETATESSSSAPASATASAEEASGAQTVKDACLATSSAMASASQELSAASAAISQSGSTDPQSTIDAFSAAVDALGGAATAVGNAEVKATLTDLHTNYATLRDQISAILINQDLSSMGDFATTASNIQSSVAKFQSLCLG